MRKFECRELQFFNVSVDPSYFGAAFLFRGSKMLHRCVSLKFIMNHAYSTVRHFLKIEAVILRFIHGRNYKPAPVLKELTFTFSHIKMHLRSLPQIDTLKKITIHLNIWVVTSQFSYILSVIRLLIKAKIKISIVEFEHIDEFIAHDDPDNIIKLEFIRERIQSIDCNCSIALDTSY